jgi:hypothetical protein
LVSKEFRERKEKREVRERVRGFFFVEVEEGEVGRSEVKE